MNFLILALGLFLSSAVARITITYPENNVTARKAFDTLFSKLSVQNVQKCGEHLWEKRPDNYIVYSNCIKALNVPKIFEDKFLKLSNTNFDGDGIEFCGTMSSIYEQVSKELEVACSGLDKDKFDQAAYDKIMSENNISGDTFNSHNSSSDEDDPNVHSPAKGFKMDFLHLILIFVIFLLLSGAVIYYLNTAKSVKVNRKLVNEIAEKV